MPPAPDKPPPPPLDLLTILATLDRHRVEYLLVGGAAANGYGAARLTRDADCVVRGTRPNLERLATAMRELGARLRVEGLSDEEAKELPVQLDGLMFANNEITTWRTDAGDLDVLMNIPAADGQRLRYEDLAGRANLIHAEQFTMRAASLPDIIASKEWADRPKDHEALPELRALQDRHRDTNPEP